MTDQQARHQPSQKPKRGRENISLVEMSHDQFLRVLMRSSSSEGEKTGNDEDDAQNRRSRREIRNPNDNEYESIREEIRGSPSAAAAQKKKKRYDHPLVTEILSRPISPERKKLALEKELQAMKAFLSQYDEAHEWFKEGITELEQAIQEQASKILDLSRAELQSQSNAADRQATIKPFPASEAPDRKTAGDNPVLSIPVRQSRPRSPCGRGNGNDAGRQAADQPTASTRIVSGTKALGCAKRSGPGSSSSDTVNSASGGGRGKTTSSSGPRIIASDIKNGGREEAIDRPAVTSAIANTTCVGSGKEPAIPSERRIVSGSRQPGPTRTQSPRNC